MDQQQLDECYEFVKNLVLKCGEIVKKGSNNIGEVKTKADFYDLVTKYDGEVEEILINGIKEKYPSHW